MKIIFTIIISLSVYALTLFLFNKGNENYYSSKGPNKSFNILVIGLFITLFLLIVVFSKINCTGLSISLVGFLFAFIAGIISLNASKNKSEIKNRLLPSIVVIIGLIIMELSLICFVSPEYTDLILENLAPILLFALFPISGIFMLYEGFRSIIKPRKYSVIVSAQCVDLKTRIEHEEVNDRIRYQETYCPVYEYNFNGLSYRVCDNIYTNKKYCPQYDSEVSLFINPDEPDFFWDVSRRRTKGTHLIILGFIFVLVSMIVTFLSLTK